MARGQGTRDPTGTDPVMSTRMVMSPAPEGGGGRRYIQGTMRPQPELARHRGFRRLVVNGVKYMSTFSALSTYHEYANIFPISCTVFALQKPKVRTLKKKH